MEHERQLHIDPDITRAHTPPGWLYTDPVVFERLRAAFTTSWLWLDAAFPDESQQARPATLLEGYLDEPLVLTRDEAGERRCLSNVCTHRAALVCTEPGPCQSLRCGYHGRTFGLDGRFLAMPEFEGVEDFPTPADDLAQLPTGSLGPMHFVALQTARSFDQWLAPLLDRVPFADFDSLEPLPERSRDYEFAANWLLYCENYVEGFHIPFVHKSLNQKLDFGAYRTDLFVGGSVQVGVARDDEVAFDQLDDGDRVAGYYVWMFPNLMLNLYPWGVSLNAVTPLAVDRSRVSFRAFAWNETLLDQGAGTDLEAVEMEDEAIVEQVQVGVGSRLYGHGRYSPSQERGTHQLHRMIAEVLAN